MRTVHFILFLSNFYPIKFFLAVRSISLEMTLYQIRDVFILSNHQLRERKPYKNNLIVIFVRLAFPPSGEIPT